MNGLSFHNNCGRSPFVDSEWHYCLPFLHDAPFDLCGLGEMTPETIAGFIGARPFLQDVRRLGVVEAIRARRQELDAEGRAQLDRLFDPEVRVSAAYRGCLVCREAHDRLSG